MPSYYFSSQEILLEGISKLKHHNVTSPELDAKVLLSHAIKSKQLIHMHNELSISKYQKNTFNRYLNERLFGKPVSRIIGSRNFWKKNFLINDYTLDPRADSETIVEIIVKYYPIKEKNTIQVLDIGAGSGCLGLSIIDEIPESSLLSLDYCSNALNIVKKNAKRLNLNKKIKCEKINWFDKNWTNQIKSKIFNKNLFSKDKFDIIVCNPPYIRSSDIMKLAPEVKHYDPTISLDGGVDGCDSYRAILSDIKELMSPDGICLVEIGFDMMLNVKKIIEICNLKLINVHKDLNGHDRVAEIK